MTFSSHRELVWGFFHNAIHLLRPYCEIHISHKTGRSYDKWGLEDLASGASLVLVDKVAFQPEDYPGYNQKRGDSARCDEPFGLDACFTFMFRIRDLSSGRKLNGTMTTPISSLRIMAPATERGPFHLFSPAESWPRQHLPPRVNAVQMVETLETYEVVRRQHLDFPLNFDGIVRDLYFHQERNARPMFRTPGPSLQALPDPSIIPPPRGRIPCPDLIAPQEEHWHQHRSAAGVPGRHHSYLAQEHQWSPRREHEMWGQVMPRATNFGHSALLEHRNEHRDRESVEKQTWLRGMVALYGRQ